jgi:transcriptional regulatory protein LevR
LLLFLPVSQYVIAKLHRMNNNEIIKLKQSARVQANYKGLYRNSNHIYKF